MRDLCFICMTSSAAAVAVTLGRPGAHNTAKPGSTLRSSAFPRVKRVGGVFVMRWGNTPSFLSSAGSCTLGSRDEDVYFHPGQSDLQPSRKQLPGSKKSVLQPVDRVGGKLPLKPRPRPGKISIAAARSSCAGERATNSGALPASTALGVAGVTDTTAIGSFDLFAAPLLVCAGSGVLQGSNNSEQSTVSCGISATCDGNTRMGLQQAAAASDGTRKRSDRPTGSLIRSDSELEVIIQELREHISQQHRATDRGKPQDVAAACDNDSTHQRRHLKNAVEKVSQAAPESTPGPTNSTNVRHRPATGFARRASLAPPSPLLTNEGVRPVLVASAASFEVATTRSNRSAVVADSRAQSSGAQLAANDEADEKTDSDLNQRQCERAEGAERRLVEGAVLNPRPARVKPPVPVRTSITSKTFVAVRTPPATGSEQLRPRRERMRVHDYALAVDSDDDSSGDNSTDTEAGSPVGPWMSSSDFAAEWDGNDKHAASSPTASVSASSSRSFYDEEIAGLSPRSHLLWLSDFAADDEGSGTRSASDLLRWRWQCESESDADRPEKTLVRTKSCVNTRVRKGAALGQSRKPIRCASANPSRRSSGGSSTKDIARRRSGGMTAASETSKIPPRRPQQPTSGPFISSETSQQGDDN